MHIKRRYQLLIVFIVVCAFFLETCRTNSSPVEIIDGYNQQQLDQLTLASLKRVDDYPLYVMTYYGDYDFSEYLQTGNLDFSYVTTSYQPDSNPWACTCFAAMSPEGYPIFGRNFDWVNRACLLLFTNPPDAYASVSMVDLNYFGYNADNLPDASNNRERLLDTPFLPFDGMNENGVTIGMMAIPEAESPYDPQRITIGEIQVNRLVLDYAKNTEEAISLIQQYNVRMETPPIHYLIADPAGHSAIVEFVDGEMIVIRNDEPYHVCTNFIVLHSSAPSSVSCWRYRTAYSTLKEANGNISPKEAMDVLNQVSQSSTMWSLVYCMNTGKISVAVGRNYENVMEFTLKENG
jgi:hypothetical protein